MRLGCAQVGGVVSMNDGAVTFKGGTITNTWATVRTGHDLRSHACTGCRTFASSTWRGVWRTQHADAGLDGLLAGAMYAVSAAGCIPHLGMWPAP